jgi:hypothetical protein
MMVVTMAVQSRVDMATANQSCLETRLLVDENRNGLIWSFRRALGCAEIMDPDEWLVVLQDDAVPAEGLDHDTLKAILDLSPAPIVAPYQARKSDETIANLHNTAWINNPTSPWGIAQAFRAGTALALLNWEQANVPDWYPHDDGRTLLFALLTRTPVAVPVKGLFQHGAPYSSTMGHGSPIVRGRTANTLAQFPSAADYARNTDFPRGAPSYGPVTRRALSEIKARHR